MLQDIRANSQGTIAKIIIGLIVISFSIFGIESLLFSGSGTAPAEVNGEEISAFALQQEVFVQQRQLLAMLGDNADPSLLDDARLSAQALDSLVEREVLTQEAEKLRIGVADSALGELVASMEQFQIDGQFSPDMFQSALANAGFTPALFRERLAEDMQVGQLRAGLAGSDFTTDAELAVAAQIAMEGRDVRYISVPLADFVSEAAPSDDEVERYYDEHPDEFMSEESVVLDYIELNLDDYRQPIDESRLREEFELTRGEYELSAEARVSHILLEGSADSRQQRAAEVIAALEAGTDFSDAAREFSDDIGSAQTGGDLGYTAGDTFPEPMELAIAAMAVGDISDPVETDAGTHILLLTDRRDGREVQFEDIVTELEDNLQRSDAGAELLQDVERLRDLAFNAADLSGPAQELDLSVRRSEPLSRGSADELFSRPAVREAIFSDDVLEAGHNSEVLEISPERFIALRVAERQPPALQALDSVRDGIADRLREQAAREAATSRADELLAALEAGESVEAAANAANLEWQVELSARRTSPRLPPVVRSELFAMAAPEPGKPRRSIIEGGTDTLFVMEFVRVESGELAAMPATEQTQLRQRIAGETGGLVQQQYENTLRERADIKVF